MFLYVIIILNLVNLSPNFVVVAKLVLSCHARLADRIGFICDTFKHTLIKDMSREDRSSVTEETKLSGSGLRRPNNFGAALTAGSFRLRNCDFWQKSRVV